MADNLAYIDYEKCKLCRKCVEVCPTDAIHELNFPPRKPKTETVAEPSGDAAPSAETKTRPVKKPATESNDTQV
jgi:ferredoxin